MSSGPTILPPERHEQPEQSDPTPELPEDYGVAFGLILAAVALIAAVLCGV